MLRRLSIAVAVMSLLTISSPSFAQFDFRKLQDVVEKMQGQGQTVEPATAPVAPMAAPVPPAPPVATVTPTPVVAAATPSTNAGTKIAAQPNQTKDVQQLIFKTDTCKKPDATISKIELTSLVGDLYWKHEAGMYWWRFAADGKKDFDVFIQGQGFDQELDKRLNDLSEGKKKVRLDGEIIYYKKKQDGFALNGCADSKLSWSSAITATSATPTSAPSSVAATAIDNPTIESWVKTCMPFTAPTNLEKQISGGKVSFRGIQVASVDTVDSGPGSVMSVRLAVTFADFKTRYPEFSKKIKLPKNKTCPMGIERSLTEQSFTGVKGATIECNCMTGGD